MPRTKQIVTLNIGDYAPEVTSQTFPLLERYAHKCCADFHVITERKWPQEIANFEKFQMYERAQQYDFSLFIDADALVFPEAPDFSELVNDDQVALYMPDFSPERFRPTRYTSRDGRWIGAGTWFVGCSRLTYELWTPPTEAELEEAHNNIFPTSAEERIGFPKIHLVDDYMLTQNIARFGLRVWTVLGYLNERRLARNWFWHDYRLTNAQKAAEIAKLIANLGRVEDCADGK
jgi:hypothetical protein